MNKYLTKISEDLKPHQPNQLGSTTEREQYGRLGSFFSEAKGRGMDTEVNMDSGNGAPV